MKDRHSMANCSIGDVCNFMDIYIYIYMMYKYCALKLSSLATFPETCATSLILLHHRTPRDQDRIMARRIAWEHWKDGETKQDLAQSIPAFLIPFRRGLRLQMCQNAATFDADCFICRWLKSSQPSPHHDLQGFLLGSIQDCRIGGGPPPRKLASCPPSKPSLIFHTLALGLGRGHEGRDVFPKTEPLGTMELGASCPSCLEVFLLMTFFGNRFLGWFPTSTPETW